jgi:hypothetical protein
MAAADCAMLHSFLMHSCYCLVTSFFLRSDLAYFSGERSRSGDTEMPDSSPYQVKAPGYLVNGEALTAKSRLHEIYQSQDATQSVASAWAAQLDDRRQRR